MIRQFIGAGRLRAGAALLAATLVVPSSLAAARQIVTGGPPPEVRALIEAFVSAINGTGVAEWEQFAQARFAAEFLKARTSEERARLFERVRADFGPITVGHVMRRGPEAPLELNVTGAKGASGVIALTLDGASPPRIANLTVTTGRNDGGPRDDGIPRPPVTPAMSSEDMSRALDAYFARLAAADTFSGVALVARAGVPIFYKAYGLADRASKRPNTVRTRFNVGSINKTFTQIAIAQLIGEGKLAATDTLGKFFPDYGQDVSRTATVDQLLNHQGGLADFFGPEFSRTAKDRFRSNADYFRFVSGLAPTFAPGTRRQYCNGCYIALGAIVERVSGMPYERYVAEYIFRRAEMNDTGYPQSDGVEPDLAVGYTRRNDGGPDSPTLRSNLLLHGAAGSAAGGGYSTAMDLLSFVKAVRANRFPGAEANMGIAGGAPGTSAVVEVEGEWAVIVLTNLDPPVGEQIGVAVMEALRR